MLDNKENILENSDELDIIIILNDENGEDIRFEFLDLIEHDRKEYVVLLPMDDDEEETGEVMILQVEESSDDEKSYVSVDDEEMVLSIVEYLKDAPLYDTVSVGEKEFLLVHSGLGEFEPKKII